MSNARDERDEEVDMLREQLRDLQMKQQERIEEAKQEARRDTIREYENDRLLTAANRIATCNVGSGTQTSEHNVNYQYHSPGMDVNRTGAGLMMMRRTSTIPPWDGKNSAGESLQSKLRTFQVQMHNYFQDEGCCDALFT